MDCPTREDKILDLLYANVGNAHKATALLPLGGSDHNLAHPSPSYTPVAKRQPVTTRTVKYWSQEAEESLQDWSSQTGFFSESYVDGIKEFTDCISEYIRLCADANIPSREI